VSHQTVNRVLDERYESGPSADTILKISEATGVSAVTLFEMAYPEARQASALSADSRALAQRIERLPPELKAAIIAILRGAPE
jgi:transcriptional regulator with XRE-family HTH domain